MQLPGNKPAFSIFGWPVYVDQSVRYGTLALIVVFTLAAVLFTDLTPLDSLIAGLLAMLLHWFAEIVHQYGHKLAADLVGHPSSGLRLWGILSTILYPNRGPLPPKIHIRRALGGPIMSLLTGALLLLPAMWLWPMGGMARFLIGFLLFESIIVFGLGALLPVRTKWLTIDGGTIWQQWRASKKKS